MPLVLLGLYCTVTLVGCAGAIPSTSFGESRPSFGASPEMPRRIMIRSSGIAKYDPAGDVLRSELPALGFIVVLEDPDAVFDATIRTSDFSPVQLELVLSDSRTGRVLWSASIVKRWDFYASIVSASERNAHEAMALFRSDLARPRTPN